MRTSAIVLACALAAAALVIGPVEAPAYDSYSGCSSCHPDFQGKGATHDLHVQSGMTSNCLLCHTSTGDTPLTYSSGDGIGCIGCHGRDYGGSTGVQAAGLRAHHSAAGITSCGICHSTDPAPMAENIPPPYYTRTDVAITDPCATATPGGEDWSGDGTGLDNDGDMVYDMNDQDCQVPVEKTSWGAIKALYDLEL